LSLFSLAHFLGFWVFPTPREAKNATITRYVYDLEDILFEYDGNNQITARYAHGPGIDDLIAMDRGGESYFYHTDGLGSITGITDSSKQPAASYGYDAFGNIISQTGTLTNPYTFTGREYDPESGLYYYRARYYDPGIGRFLQPDPLDMATVILIRQYFPDDFHSDLFFQYALRNPEDVINVYSYIANSPINWIDPYGLFKWKTSPHLRRGIKGGIAAIIGYGLDIAIAKTNPGVFRGVLVITKGGLLVYSGVQAGGLAIAVGIATLYDPDPITKVFGIAATVALASGSGYLLGEGFANISIGIEEVKKYWPQGEVCPAKLN